MKIVIVFYSFSDKTKRICDFLKEKFIAKGNNVDILALKPINEETSFLLQGKQAMYKLKVPLMPVNYDLANYDLVIFASPVWAFTITPAVRTYLEKISSLENKKIGCIITHASGLGSQKALEELASMTEAKKGEVIFKIKLPGYKSKDSAFLDNKFRDVV